MSQPTDAASGAAPEVVRRHFVAIATSDYDDHRCRPLPGVVGEVDVLRRWLCTDLMADRRFTPLHEHLARNPTEDDIRAALRRPTGVWTHDDAAVVFVTGHGMLIDGAHWLILKESDTSYPAGSAIRTADLISWLSQHRDTPMMVIFDLCYAGAAGEETIRFDHDLPRHWLVLASVTKTQQARTGGLTGVIGEILAELSRPGDTPFGEEQYLDVATFFGEVQRRLRLAGQDLVALDHRVLPAGPHPCLPNPRYRASAVPPVHARRRDLALRLEDLESHWGPRARGVMRHDETGWLFTGREELMRALIAAATGPPGTHLVTGGAGCGKSAVLARLVTLSDPTFLDRHADRVERIPLFLRPPPEAVDVAVLATGKVADEVMGQICAAFEVPAPPASSQRSRISDLREVWWSWLAAQDKTVTIVVDALDEATQPASVLTEVLTRLEPPDASRRQVRLIVGVRSPGSPDTAPADARAAAIADQAESALDAQRMRVDQTPWWSDTDLVGYVSALLLTIPDSPYAHAQTSATSTIAATIAGKSGTSFLMARLAAASLAARTEVVKPDDPDWLASLDDGVVGVFRADLHATLKDLIEREKAVHLLRAVAFAKGRGLPWYQIWPRVANAVANHPERIYGDTDIAWLLASRLGGYLVTDTEDDITVYRLFHDALRQALRERWRDLLRSEP